MTATTIELDEYRGIASRKATKARRLLASVDRARAAFQARNEGQAALNAADTDPAPKA